MRKALFLALGMIVNPAAAQAADLARCFTNTELGNWTAAPDAKSIYFRVGANRFYRLDLGRECSPLKWPEARLITHIRGTGLVCSAFDLDVKASGPGDIPEACFAKQLTQLSASEFDALPRKLKP